MRHIYFIAILFFIIISACTNTSVVEQIEKSLHDPHSKEVLVAAHRAAHNGYPENSLPAVQHAIDLGLDIVEVDIRVTRDGVPILMHNKVIDDKTDGTGDPESYVLKDLQKFRLKMADGSLSEEHIPTFEDVLNLARGKIMIDVDIKTGNLKPITDVVKKTGMQQQVFYFDDDYLSLKEILSLDPGAMIMPRAYSYQMADSALRIFTPIGVHIDDSFYTPQTVRLISEKNARIWINALGETDQQIREGEIEEAMDSLLYFHANMIQTDEPEKILNYLRSKKLHR